MGNALWRGEPLDHAARSRILALFRLTIADRARVEPRAAGHPVYLFLAMTPDNRLRLKPQNLITGLPLAAAAEAA